MSNNKSNIEDDGVPPRRSEGSNKNFSIKPFKESLKSIKTGPECLECGGPIDTRLGWSINNLHGTRRDQRNGYLHADCHEIAEKRFKEEAIASKTNNETFHKYVKFIDNRPAIKVPAYFEEEINEYIKSK
jgi:hypothetical protein